MVDGAGIVAVRALHRKSVGIARCDFHHQSDFIVPSTTGAVVFSAVAGYAAALMWISQVACHSSMPTRSSLQGKFITENSEGGSHQGRNGALFWFNAGAAPADDDIIQDAVHGRIGVG